MPMAITVKTKNIVVFVLESIRDEKALYKR